VAVIGAMFATQYARQRFFSLLAPALVGLALSWACGAATGSSSRPRRSALLVAATFAVLSAALAFALTPGGQNPLHPPGRVLPPYAAGVVGVLAWPLLFGPPRRRGQPAQSREQPTEDRQPEVSVDL
jgi:peptidoglycan/LPS O-acetylase OafA/YrhL